MNPVQAAIQKRKQQEKPKHTHNWKLYKQNLAVDNIQFKYSNAYFKVFGCEACKTKVVADYIIE